jgi:hypothetical protein
MYTTLFVSFFLAITGINAAPSLVPRLPSIPVEIYTGAGCNNSPTPITTAYVPTDGSCFPISPIVSGNTDSGLLNTNQVMLPAGCTGKREFRGKREDVC